jgi:hypothetical protein
MLTVIMGVRNEHPHRPPAATLTARHAAPPQPPQPPQPVTVLPPQKRRALCKGYYSPAARGIPWESSLIPRRAGPGEQLRNQELARSSSAWNARYDTTETRSAYDQLSNSGTQDINAGHQQYCTPPQECRRTTTGHQLTAYSQSYSCAHGCQRHPKFDPLAASEPSDHRSNDGESGCGGLRRLSATQILGPPTPCIAGNPRNAPASAATAGEGW